MKKSLALVAVALIITVPFVYGCRGTESTDIEQTTREPASAASTNEAGSQPDMTTTGSERIVLGGGCFWCTEAVFDLVEGVTETISGYAGGTTADPSYEEVCGGDTGHAEVVSVTYDPGRVSLEELLEVFFISHDPTTLNRQGADVGTQYRSIILYTSEDQKARIDAFIDEAGDDYGDSIVTVVEESGEFFPAEDYHQDYYEKNPDAPYCAAVISPKLEKVIKLLESK